MYFESFRKFSDFEITRMITYQIAVHSVKLPLVAHVLLRINRTVLRKRNSQATNQQPVFFVGVVFLNMSGLRTSSSLGGRFFHSL